MPAPILAPPLVQPAPAPAAAEDLAFELGRAHALRQLCVGREDGLWRDKMSDLMTAEQASPQRRQRLVMRFNAGFADARAAFPACGEPAQAALRDSARRGAVLARALAAAPRP